MPAYTITDVVGDPREWEGKFGKNLSYKVALKDVEELVELSQKPDTPAPTVGQALEGEIQPSTNGNFPPRFKKVRKDGGGFGGGGMSPERERRITRLHSQEMALRYVAAKVTLGDLKPEDFTMENLTRVIDWFEKDAGV